MDIQIDLTKTILETERLILRPFADNDLADLNEYASVEGVGEMAGWKHHKNIEETEQILDMFIEEKNVLAIVLKESDKVIGSLGLHLSWANCDDRYRDLKQKEVGYVLSKAYWGRGLVSEAVRAVIDFCFNDLGLEALSVGHFLTNNQSRRVIEKCGFIFVKKDKYYAKQLDMTFDDMQYILLREDFIMNTENNTNWNFAASGLVIRDNKVLLVRHTYGSAKGKLLIPGGFCQVGELPEAAAIRECFEETSVHASVLSLLAMRFSGKSWYPVFIMKYESGEPVSDGKENSEAIFMDIEEAINHPDITNMTKLCLQMYQKSSESALRHYPDYGVEKGFSLYGTDM